MLNPRLTNYPACLDVISMLENIDCRLNLMAKRLYNNVIFSLNLSFDSKSMFDLLCYKRILIYKYCNSDYAGCYSLNIIGSRVSLLTSGCIKPCYNLTVIPKCNLSGTVVEITTSTSTSSTSTSTTTSSTSTSTSSTSTSSSTLSTSTSTSSTTSTSSSSTSTSSSTSSSSSSSSSSSTSTTTTDLTICYNYYCVNNDQVEQNLFWDDCETGTPTVYLINPGQTLTICARTGSVTGEGFSIDQNDPCSETTSTTSTSSTSTSTSTSSSTSSSTTTSTSTSTTSTTTTLDPDRCILVGSSYQNSEVSTTSTTTTFP